MQTITDFAFPTPFSTDPLINYDAAKRRAMQVEEEDVQFDVARCQVTDDMELQTQIGTFPIHQHAMKQVAKMVRYPTSNFKTALPVDRVAGDMNILLTDYPEDLNVVCRLQNGNIYAFYPIGRRTHIPPMLKQTAELADMLINDFTQAKGDVETRADFRNGVFRTSMLAKNENIAFPDDPSYGALIMDFFSRDSAGAQSGYHLLRTSCTNSSVFHREGGWTYAGADRDLSLDLYVAQYKQAKRTLHLLGKVYRDLKMHRIDSKLEFGIWEKMVREFMGRETPHVLTKWYELDVNDTHYYDPDEAAGKERDNVYALFNDITYYSRYGACAPEIKEKASLCAGSVFKRFYNKHLDEFYETEGA